jgi:hypothetical protein
MAKLSQERKHQEAGRKLSFNLDEEGNTFLQ